MFFPQGDQWATAFLAGEPNYDRPAWLDAYAMTIGRYKPELSPEQAAQLASEAYKSQGHMNPKISAGLDVALGPYKSDR